MKILFATAGLALLSLELHAQDAAIPQSRLKPLHNPIALDFEGKDYFSSRHSVPDKPDLRYSLFPKAPKSAEPAKAAIPISKMPILAPDSTIWFSILAIKPDSTRTYPMPVIKP